MPADLVGSHYPEQNVFDSILGQQRNATQVNIPVYSNRAILGGDWTDAAASLVSGKLTHDQIGEPVLKLASPTPAPLLSASGT